MARSTRHVKLGLFVLTAIAAAVAAVLLLGGSRWRKDVIPIHSYFNESVQGLELGAPVKFRGVTLGHVTAIEIAPDRRMVDVACELDLKDVNRMGLTERGPSGRQRLHVPDDLRAQLNSQGITGIKFVSIDFFDVKAYPKPQLSFHAREDQYVPAAPSMMKNLEDTINRAMDCLPEMVDAVVLIMSRVDSLVATLVDQDVTSKVVTTLNQTNQTIQRLDGVLAEIQGQRLGEKAASTLSALHVAAERTNGILTELSGRGGLLASATEATNAFREVGRAGYGTQRELEATLRNVSEAAEALRTLIDSLERDPDMLLKGKTVRRTPE
ncbi:MAG: MlaD family protein [Polyangiaceae bacterium]